MLKCFGIYVELNISKLEVLNSTKYELRHTLQLY